jgi:phosphatidate cytidylyltransferase
MYLGVLIALLAQFGDLAESILKRDLGVKDSSGLPGMEGFLDILDSLVFTVPLVYLFLKFTHT